MRMLLVLLIAIPSISFAYGPQPGLNGCDYPKMPKAGADPFAWDDYRYEMSVYRKCMSEKMAATLSAKTNETSQVVADQVDTWKNDFMDYWNGLGRGAKK